MIHYSCGLIIKENIDFLQNSEIAQNWCPKTEKVSEADSHLGIMVGRNVQVPTELEKGRAGQREVEGVGLCPGVGQNRLDKKSNYNKKTFPTSQSNDTTFYHDHHRYLLRFL